MGGLLAALRPQIKHPAVLPMTSLISVTEQMQHQGPGITMNELQPNSIWKLGCSHAVSSYSLRCASVGSSEGVLKNREWQTYPANAWRKISLYLLWDGLFWPILCKGGKKGAEALGLLFTCLYSCAVNIELLDDMMTDSFFSSLHDFIALLGNVSQL